MARLATAPACEAKLCLFPTYSRFGFATPVVGGFDSRDERLKLRFCDHMRSSGIIIVLGIPAFLIAIVVAFNDMIGDYSGLDTIAVPIAVVGVVAGLAVILKNFRPG